MTDIRLIDLKDATIGDWAGVDQLMFEQMKEGTFQETIVVFRWSEAHSSLALGTDQDGDELDRKVVRNNGYIAGRRLAAAGGTGFHLPCTPVVTFYYRKPYDGLKTTMHSEADINGEANTAALRSIGIPAEYRSIGDTEIVEGEDRFKVMASTAVNYGLPDLWMACTSIIWEQLPENVLAVITQAVKAPPEKFEDKKVKSVIARIVPLVEVAKKLGITINLEELIQATIEENVRALMQGKKVVPSAFSIKESEFIAVIRAFSESSTWHYRLSTRRFCLEAPPTYQVGVAAYKSRKLVKVSVIVDPDGKIHNVMYTGDAYVRPLPTLLEPGLLGLLNNAIRGLPINDEKALNYAVEKVFAMPGVEAVLMEPSHFVAPVIRAGEKLQPIAKYLANC